MLFRSCVVLLTDKIAERAKFCGFRKKERRTWYCERPMTRSDYAVLIVAALLSLGGIAITFANGGRFFNPFR